MQSCECVRGPGPPPMTHSEPTAPLRECMRPSRLEDLEFPPLAKRARHRR